MPATPEDGPAGEGPSSLPQVETLRVLALGWIFLFHLWSLRLPSTVGDGPLWRVLSFGYLGAFFFNMITGLVLALPYLAPEGRPMPRYREFLRRRFVRIFPNYFLALILWSLPALAEAGRLEGHLLRSFLSHLLFLHTLSPETFFDIVPAFWWLALVAQFYLVFPPLLRLFVRLGAGRTLFLCCLICWGGWAILRQFAPNDPTSLLASIDYMIYYNLPVRLPEFAMGMWLARLMSTQRHIGSGGTSVMGRWRLFNSPFLWLVLGSMLLAAAWLTLPLDAMPIFHFYQVAWCLLAFTFALSWMPMSAAGRSKPIRFLAGTSYSFYLMHQPVLGYAKPLLEHLSGPMQLPALTAFSALVSLLLSLGLDSLVSGLKGNK